MGRFLVVIPLLAGHEPSELSVLTACRIWHFIDERRHASKTEAAEWVLARQSALDVVRDALRHRQLGPSIAIDGAQVRYLLDVVRARVQEARERA